MIYNYQEYLQTLIERCIKEAGLCDKASDAVGERPTGWYRTMAHAWRRTAKDLEKFKAELRGE